MRLPAPNLAGHKNSYNRPGVLDGNFAEDLLAADAKGRPGFVLDRGGAFAATTTTQATFTAQGKSGAELAAAARREDIALKYVKYGKSSVLPDDKTGFWASTTQLAYDGTGHAPAAAAPAAGGDRPASCPTKVQDCLWGASKFENRKVPVSAQAYSLSTQRRQQLEAEQAASPYRTVEKDCLAAAARDEAARLAAKPPIAQPHDPKGEEAQTGRKVSGDFVRLFDKDWVRIGLRKGGAAKS
ncbi:hypothetical protein ABPG75_001546 [Micractinium tetrahymenae]